MRLLRHCLFLSIVLSIALCGISAVHAAESVNVTIRESGRITSYFNEYWVVNVDGNITVTNPTDRDLYAVEIRYNLGSLVIIETSSTTYFQGGQMIINRIPANSSVSASYNIVGISLSDPTLINKGVLYSAMTQFAPVIYSDSFGSLQKANLEDASYTGRPGRLISVELNNPSGFQFTIVSLRVFKTPELDPNNMLDEWQLVNESSPVTVDPDTIFVRDILDTNSAEGQVYWLSADMYISRVSFYDISNITRYTEENLTIPPELLNYSINTSNSSNRSFAAVTEVYAKKLADAQIVTADKPVQISFIVNNFAQKLYEYTITDELPPGFSFLGGDGWTEQNGALVYSGSLSAKSAAVPSYTARLTDTDAAGLDYFDAAQIDYSPDRWATEKTVYSDRVPFIRQFLPGKRLYVQKKLSYVSDTEVEVTITVQNLGDSPVENLLLKDYLNDGDAFSQITEVPLEKGMWEIAEIKRGETWEVTYTTSEDANLNVLPGLFGIPSGDILKSLVLENVIAAGWEAVRTAAVEVLGIGVLIGLPVLYYFYVRRRRI